MIKLPKDKDNQIKDYNKKCKNGFHINILKYLTNSEYEVLKEEKTEKENIYQELKLNYEDKNITLTITNLEKKDKNNIIEQKINSIKITLKENINKRTLSTLIKETKSLNEENIKKILNTIKGVKKNQP